MLRFALTIVMLAFVCKAQAQTPIPARMKGYHWAVVRTVVDGDSVRVTVPVWRKTPFYNVTLRLYGIDTPETRKGFYKCTTERDSGVQATLFLAGLLPRSARIRFIPVQLDKYGGRLDSRVRLPDGRDASSLMLERGFAVPYIGKGKRPSWCQ